MVIIESDFKPFRVEKIEKKNNLLEKKEKFSKFFWGKIPGSLTGDFDWKIFFLHFYAQNDLILKIEQKKFFRKKIFFSEKKIFRAPQKWPFSAISRPNIFFLTCGFLQKFKNDPFFRFKPFPDKTNAKFFFKVPKTSKKLIFGHFLAKIWPKHFFFKNRALSVICIYFLLIISRKSEKTNDGN